MTHEISVLEKISPATDRRLKEYLQHFGQRPEDLLGKRVLNVGAGRSNIGREIAEKYQVPCQVVNINIAYNPKTKGIRPSIWKVPRTLFPQNAIWTDAAYLPFQDNCFDLTLAQSAIS